MNQIETNLKAAEAKTFDEWLNSMTNFDPQFAMSGINHCFAITVMAPFVWVYFKLKGLGKTKN